ncbi:Cell division control protein 2 like C [Apostasia shenzhenica]|uniref:Cell division control protein 2 like C n=1 Tax=Apostasia shenzhenica TaxID=1088818 RepID=A0A2I0A8I9_9ASPA|nr:Cell division control protein 2 like C [Apostasia shenzhenica]
MEKLNGVGGMEKLQGVAEMERYKKLEKVGEGTYGKVFKAQDLVTGQLVALKKTRLEMGRRGIPPTTPPRDLPSFYYLSESMHIVRYLFQNPIFSSSPSCSVSLLYHFWIYPTSYPLLCYFVDYWRWCPLTRTGRLILYLVFEYLDTDLRKYIDSYKRGPNPRPLPPQTIQVGKCLL